jgi:hypothetical protein
MQQDTRPRSHKVAIPLGRLALHSTLALPPHPAGLVLFAHSPE